MILRGQTVAARAAAGSRFAKLVLFMTNSVAMRLLLAMSIVVILVLVPRPSQLMVVFVALAATLFILAHRPDAAFSSTLRGVLRATWPLFALFLCAALVAGFTAFAPGVHFEQLPKILGLQFAVLVLYCLGRLAGPVPWSTLLAWIFGILVVSTLLLLVEEGRFVIHQTLGIIDLGNPANYAALNRAFLMLTLALVFLAVTAVQLKAWMWCGLCVVLVAMITVATHSDSARLVAVLAMVGLLPWVGLHRTLLSTAFAGAVIAMLAGPFVYDSLLSAWQAGPLTDYKVGTFLNRLETYADFSALIRESHFLGRGFNVSKLIANEPSLFAMPNRPCGQPGVFCPWHPHNAGLEVTTDLGGLGILWLSLVLWSIRSLVLQLAAWQQPGTIALVVGFLAVSFVADGLWQAWWWMVAGLIAMWIGILTANPDRPLLFQRDGAR